MKCILCVNNLLDNSEPYLLALMEAREAASILHGNALCSSHFQTELIEAREKLRIDHLATAHKTATDEEKAAIEAELAGLGYKVKE